jgi:hypothetical protein
VFDTALAVLLCDVAWFGIHLFLLDRGECIWKHGHFWAIEYKTMGCVDIQSSTIKKKGYVGYCIIVSEPGVLT